MSAARGPARLLAGCLTSVAVLLLLESVWRIWLLHVAPEEKLAKYGRTEDIPLERRKYVPHPYLGYALNPAYRSADGLNRHNALGFRGEEIEVAKPAGVFRIACLGGSTTYDVEIEDWRRSFPAQLETVLREERGHPEVRVVNAGVGGYNSWETLVNLELRVLQLAPDLVILYDNANDAHARFVPPESYRRDGTGHRHAWKDEYPWWDHSLLVRYFGVQWGFSPRNTLEERTKCPVPEALDRLAALDANPPAYFEDNLDDMIVLAGSHGARVMLASFAYCDARGGYAAEPYYARAFQEHDEVLRRAAERTGAAFYDFRAAMPAGTQYWVDGVHHNELGARTKAELFAAFVAERFLAPKER